MIWIGDEEKAPCIANNDIGLHNDRTYSEYYVR